MDMLQRFYAPPYVRTNTVFFEWIHAALRPTDVVLDAGAGPRGPDPAQWLRGKAANVCGIDPDETVLENDQLDEARLIVGGCWPYPDTTFDVVLSDYVLEHVADPSTFFAELRRVLKRNGVFFFRTVNAWHPGVIVGRWLPLGIWTWLVRRLDPRAADRHDPYATYWRANTATRLTQLLRANGFRHIDMRTREEPPIYLARCPSAAMVGILWERVANRCDMLGPVRVTLYGCASAAGLPRG